MLLEKKNQFLRKKVDQLIHDLSRYTYSLNVLHMKIGNSRNPHDKTGLGYSDIPCIIEPPNKRAEKCTYCNKRSTEPLNVTLGKEFLKWNLLKDLICNGYLEALLLLQDHTTKKRIGKLILSGGTRIEGNLPSSIKADE